ncbi:sugar transporter [Neorhizobium sp. P12A]|uniref:GumC family protein n=1 Tax=Neorhizobium sp. P12A TaxID=2268027 RepID=UPI0011EEEEB6|nr:GumC family protein [Neorhizobium sp. P12A]KAA0699170.1 sugar transporter [Neorhizobium sp. P12A]
MSSYEKSKGTSRLPSWRSNEPPPGQPEDLRMRGPVIRPSDFIQQPRPAPVSELRERAEEEIARQTSAQAETRPASAPVPAPSAPPQEEVHEKPVETVAPGPILDLRSAVRAIWARRLLIIILAAIMGGLGAAVIPMLPQKFTAETSLYFDPHQVSASDPQQGTAAPELISALIDSQTQILGSGKVMGRVVDALKLDQDPQFNGGATGETAKYVAIAVLQKAAVIAREATTYVVSLKVTTRDPLKSAQIANQIVTSFRDEESKAAATAYHSTNTALDSRLDDLRQQVLDAEKAAETYRADNDMVAVQGGGFISDKRLTALNDLLVTAQQKTIEAKARADAVGKLSFEDVVASTSPPALNSTSNSLTNLRQQYAVQAANVGSLESQLGARHPRLLAARSSLESIAAEIRSELQRLSTSAQSDYEQAQKAEQGIAKELAVQKATQVNTSGKLVELNELERKATAAKDIYEALMKRSDQASEDQSLSQTNIRVISEAVPPLKADGPGGKVMMVAGLIAGALFGICLGMAIAVIASLFRHPVLRGYLSK